MPLKNRKIIVTGGPTREWIDPVRYISNASSGKMGVAIAVEAQARSGNTVFIHGPMESSPLKDRVFRLIPVESTEDMLNAVLAEMTPGCVIIMAAAPADYRIKEKHPVKLKKEEGSDELILRFIKNPDILKKIAKKRSEDMALSDIFVAGFAAETDNTEANALKKLKSKNLDMICLNDVTQKDAGFNTDTNRVTVFINLKDGRDGIKKTELPLLTKKETAGRILDIIETEGLAIR